MSKAIVYQGSNEQFRCRIVSDDGEFESQSQLYETVEEAQEYAENLNLEYETRPSIADVAGEQE